MANHIRILALAGSLRSGSYNKKLVQIAAEGARREGATVTCIDLQDLPMPIYNADDEERSGKPENARKLKQLLLQHDGLLISSPEYNSSIPAVLKNAIDWASRPDPEDDRRLIAFDGKVAAIMSASPGGLGGLRGLVHLRSILSNIKVLVLPDQVAVPQADAAFDEKGRLQNEQQQASIENLGIQLAQMLGKLKASPAQAATAQASGSAV